MPLTRHIVVTQEDIAKGKPDSPRHCPIARAWKRADPEAKFVDVAPRVAYTDRSLWKGGYHTWDLPSAAQTFIMKFDGGADVEPFEFDAVEVEQP